VIAGAAAVPIAAARRTVMVTLVRAVAEVIIVMRLATLAAFFLVAVSPAAAQDAKPPADATTVEAVLRDAGLFGTWAVDCDAPAAPANPHVSIVLADAGTVIERHELGPDYEINNYRVIAASRLSMTRVAVEVLFKPGSTREQTQKLIFDVENDRRRTLFNQVAGGPVVVKDGVVVGHKVKTPTLGKCG
jgi:hypothetical protein